MRARLCGVISSWVENRGFWPLSLSFLLGWGPNDKEEQIAEIEKKGKWQEIANDYIKQTATMSGSAALVLY